MGSSERIIARNKSAGETVDIAAARVSTAGTSGTATDPGLLNGAVCLLVLGMHRSGTSAIARVLNLLGATLPQRTLDAGLGNDVGHWESAQLVDLHNQLLSEAGESWEDWRRFDIGCLPVDRQDHYRREIAQIIDEEYANASLFVLKDPRVCRFVPLYRDLFAELGISLRPVLIYRNPLAVAASIERRDNLPVETSFVYWLGHILESEVATRGLPRAVISYEALIRDWRSVVAPIGDQLGISWPHTLDAAATKIDAFLSADHQHHAALAEDLASPAYAPWLRDAFAALEMLGHDPVSAESEFDRLRKVIDTPSSLFAGALFAERRRLGATIATERHNAINERAKLMTGFSAEREHLTAEYFAELARIAAERTAEREWLVKNTGAELAASIAHARKADADKAVLKQSLAQTRAKLAESEQMLVHKTQLLLTFSTAASRAFSHARSQPFLSRVLSRLAAMIGASTIPVTEYFATNDLEPNGLPWGWRSTGNAPQMQLPVTTNAEFVRVKFTARILDKDETFEGRWQIFYTRSAAFTESLSRSVEFTGQRIEIDKIIQISPPTLAFRLNPVDRPCSFAIENFTIQPLSSTYTRLLFARSRIQRFLAADRLDRQLGKIVSEIRQGRAKVLVHRLFTPEYTVPARYETWVAKRTVTPQIAERFVAKAKSFPMQPLFSIIMPTYNSPPDLLRIAIESVRAQTYGNWELLITDDGSKRTDHFFTLKDLGAADSRIKIAYARQNGGISSASNAALARASGDYIALLDHDDELQPHALHAFAEAINANPEADWLYSDEDKITEHGKRFGPYFKPDWSPAFFTCCMYTCHLGVYRRLMVDKLGGFRSEFNMAQDYDLALRFASVTTNIVHIPDVLYHWRTLPQSTASSASAKPIAAIHARDAVQSFLDRGKYPGKVLAGPLPGTQRIRFDLVDTPLVSVAIPSAGRRSHVEGRDSWLILDLVRSIREKSTYPNLEIVIAENGDFSPTLIAALKPFKVRFVRYESETFNISDKMNLVVGATRGDYVVILNDDMEIITPEWIEEMLMWAQQDGVCGVGAKLLFPDGLIQHAGVTLLQQGPSHVYYLDPRSTPGLSGNAQSVRECMAVTGACMMMRRADYLAVGGFDPEFRINYNDVDFCLRLIEHTGGRILYSPFAELYHYESVSCEVAPPKELKMFNTKWAKYVGSDPYYNRHLSQSSSRFELSLQIASLTDEYGLGR